MADTLESFSAMLRDALGTRIDAGASSFVEMFAEDGVMEFPYAPPGGTDRVAGRAALIAYLTEVGQLLVFDRIAVGAVHETTDPETVVLEFSGSGRGTQTGEPYEQRYVSIIRTHGGRIVHYRDYWNPLALLRATRGSHHVAALTGDAVHHG